MCGHAAVGWGRLIRLYCPQSVILVLEPSASCSVPLSLDSSLKHTVLLPPLSSSDSLSPSCSSSSSHSARECHVCSDNSFRLNRNHMSSILCAHFIGEAVYTCTCAPSGLPVVRLEQVRKVVFTALFLHSLMWILTRLKQNNQSID